LQIADKDTAEPVFIPIYDGRSRPSYSLVEYDMAVLAPRMLITILLQQDEELGNALSPYTKIGANTLCIRPSDVLKGGRVPEKLSRDWALYVDPLPISSAIQISPHTMLYALFTVFLAILLHV
jgi:hypothetical protein